MRLSMNVGLTENRTPRALYWNSELDGSESMVTRIPADVAIEHTASCSEFMLRLVQRTHAFAVVVTPHPFTDEMRLLRQFLSKLEDASPVVVLLTDCPYPMIGIEREFFAVVNLEEAGSEIAERLTAVFSAALQNGKPQISDSAATTHINAPDYQYETDLTSVRRQLQLANVVSLSGELGTAKSSLVKLLHQYRQGSEQNFTSFYCNRAEDAKLSQRSLYQTIENLLQQSAGAKTFVLHNATHGLISSLAPLFHNQSADVEFRNQLVALSEQSVFAQGELNMQLLPLRDRSECIEELLAAILTVYARQLPQLKISAQAEAIRLLQKHAWPANICEFNLMIASAILGKLARASSNHITIDQQAMHEEMEIANGSQTNSRRYLRERLQHVCQQFEQLQLGIAQQMRTMLNQTLTENATLVWPVTMQFTSQIKTERVEEQIPVDVQRRAA
jgi:DNA-binding NtrC family response regulator